MMLTYYYLKFNFFSYSDNKKKSRSFTSDGYAVSFSRSYDIRANSCSEIGKTMHRYYSKGKIC
jgi:hypothetical protein